MRCLLDTHSFLWWIADIPRLSGPARSLIEDDANEIWLSVVSAWEIALLVQRARLTLEMAPLLLIPQQVAANGFSVLPVHLQHTLQVGTLPFLHRDPFDRMLVAQAQVEGLTLITGDTAITRYAVSTIW